jgi:membrane associated rhomboid family serine protease
MIPLSDASRRPLNWPVITWLIILVNGGVFLLELAFGDPFILRLSLVPAQIASGHHLETIFTAMFLHAGWLHILGNMLFLFVFGPEIEDVMGPISYLAFYLLGGVAATMAQVIVAPNSTIPNLGASGAIAAVMGAFLITFPRDRIRTLLILGWFIQVTAIPAILLIGVWFLLQLFSQLGSLVTVDSGGVAYMAHIGGFLFGLITARVFEVRRRSRQDSTNLPPYQLP